ncbi:hypothetical protein [Paraburkholderia sp.]|uniref:hypothetical protein n=1 Tax=Paraburkholderia sp. TaxID=1926495 RepID=UPI0039E4ADDC
MVWLTAGNGFDVCLSLFDEIEGTYFEDQAALAPDLIRHARFRRIAVLGGTGKAVVSHRELESKFARNVLALAESTDATLNARLPYR